MQITTIAEARSLVGRTFERDGDRREVIGVTGGMYIDYADPIDEFVFTDTFGQFSRWMSKATEIVQ